MLNVRDTDENKSNAVQDVSAPTDNARLFSVLLYSVLFSHCVFNRFVCRYPPRSRSSRVESPTRKQPSPASKHREASPTTDKMPPTPTNIKVNFRIVPRDGARAPNDAASSSRPPVSRSVSCRGRATGAWASWDRRLLAESPSDRYLDDTERRSRSLSRPGRSATYDGGDEDRRDPEWLEIARRRQTTEVDWDNLGRCRKVIWIRWVELKLRSLRSYPGIAK